MLGSAPLPLACSLHLRAAADLCPKPESNKLATIRVQDLHYGDVLWRLYAANPISIR